jgi:hypothetical protein
MWSGRHDMTVSDLHLEPQVRIRSEGKPCFLICGGPSLAGLDLTRLDRHWTMGLNNSSKIYLPRLWICTDEPTSFDPQMWRSPWMRRFVPAGARIPADAQGVVARFLSINAYPGAARFLADPVVRWGASTMFAAVRVLFDLGFRRIYLLGVDLDMDGPRAYAYEWKDDERHRQFNRRSYRLIEQRFRSLRPVLEAHGMKIWNCNPDSRLTAFDFLGYDEVIAEDRTPCPTGTEYRGLTVDTPSGEQSSPE